MSKYADLAQLFNEAMALHQQGRLEQAQSLYKRVLRKSPNQPDVLQLLGVIEAQYKRHDAAMQLFRRALAFDPKNAYAHSNFGNVLRELKRYEEALASIDRALAIAPDYADAHLNRGNVLLDQRMHEAALKSYERALEINAGNAPAWMNRGIVLFELNRVEDALASYERALAIAPQYAEAHYNRGKALREIKRHDDAIMSYDQALAIRPDYIDALYNRGNALLDLKRHEEAMVCFERVIALAPLHFDALCLCGSALHNLGRYADAAARYASALGIRPDNADALYKRSAALVLLEQYEQAAADLDRLLILRPDYEYARGDLLNARMHCCEWADFAALSIRCEEGLRAGRRVVVPFSFQAICRSADDSFACSKIYASDRYPQAATPLWQGEIYANRKIRIGYLSGEFRQHVTSVLMVGLFESHNRERFELFAFDNGHDDGSDLRIRINGAFDEIVDISRLSDHAAALAVRERQIDILVNLNGYFGKLRQGVFAYRPSPVQVNYLGFSGTIGADYIDYIVADRWIIPPEQQIHYSEKVVYLPEVYQVNDAKRVIAERAPARIEAGLPEDGFVFCSFNSNFKITPEVFDVWMRLLSKTPNSVLWLGRCNPASKRNLQLEANKRGVAAERIVFAERAERPEDHLARHRLADLFLDTLPFNAGATASDALWAGLPVLTCSGNVYVGRMAGSLLNAVGLPELVTTSLEEYEKLALKCAGEKDFLVGLKAKLKRSRATFPLFNTERFSRHLERSYFAMHERYQRGEAPAGFSVDPID